MILKRTIVKVVTILTLAALPVVAHAKDGLTVTNDDASIVLDRAAVDNLPQQEFTTTTIWTEGSITFSGPSLHAIISLAGITEGTVTLTAVNDYVIQIPVAEITETTPIVASLMDGEPFNRREKGPYWLVYPYDSDPAFQTEITLSRSIWQLVSISNIAPD